MYKKIEPQALIGKGAKIYPNTYCYKSNSKLKINQTIQMQHFN